MRPRGGTRLHFLLSRIFWKFASSKVFGREELAEVSAPIRVFPCSSGGGVHKVTLPMAADDLSTVVPRCGTQGGNGRSAPTGTPHLCRSPCSGDPGHPNQVCCAHDVEDRGMSVPLRVPWCRWHPGTYPSGVVCSSPVRLGCRCASRLPLLRAPPGPSRVTSIAGTIPGGQLFSFCAHQIMEGAPSPPGRCRKPCFWFLSVYSMVFSVY